MCSCTPGIDPTLIVAFAFMVILCFQIWMLHAFSSLKEEIRSD